MNITVELNGMKKIDESTKVTLTFGQLKKLVKESVVEPMKVPVGFIKHLVKCGAARELSQDEYNDIGPFDTIAYSMGTYGMSAKLVHKSRTPEELFVVDSSKVNF